MSPVCVRSFLRQHLPTLLVVALCVFVLQTWWTGSVGYNTFTDRDLARALRWRDELPISGAEMSRGSGARVPGIGLAVLMGSPALLFGTAQAAFAGLVFQMVAGIALLYAGTHRQLGTWAAALLSLLITTGPAVVSSTSDLWNPAFLVLPNAIAATALVRLVYQRDPRALVVFCGAVAVGAQCHLSSWLWLTLLPPLWWTHRPTLTAGTRGALAAIGIAYAPFVLVDLWRGAPALMDLWEHARIRGTEGVQRGFELSSLAAKLAEPNGRYGRMLGPVPWWLTVVVPLGTLVAWALRELEDNERTLAACAACTLGLHGLFLQISETPEPPLRYMMIAESALAILTVLGVRWAWRRAWPVAILLGLLALPRVDNLHSRWSRSDLLGLDQLERTVDAIAEETGWSMAEISGRSTWSSHRRGRVGERQYGPTFAHRLALEGAYFEGSTSPPCALVLAGPEGIAEQALRGILDVPARIIREVELPTMWRLVLYDIDDSHCPTTMSQRYVDLPSERSLKPLYRHLEDHAEALPLDPGERWVFRLDHPSLDRDCRDAPMAIDATIVDDTVHLSLVSGALRGFSDNGGWWSSCVLADPALVLEDDQGATRSLPLVQGVIGGFGIHTPVHRSVPRPTGGPFKVSLALDLVTFSDPDHHATIERREHHRIELSAAWP